MTDHVQNRRDMLLSIVAAAVVAPVGTALAGSAPPDPVFAAIAEFHAAADAHFAIIDEEEQMRLAFRSTPVGRNFGCSVGWSHEKVVTLPSGKRWLGSDLVLCHSIDDLDQCLATTTLDADYETTCGRIEEYNRQYEQAKRDAGVTAIREVSERAQAAENAALDRLLTTVPTTIPGLLAYVNALADEQYGFGGGAFRGNDFDVMCQTMLTALTIQAGIGAG